MSVASPLLGRLEEFKQAGNIVVGSPRKAVGCSLKWSGCGHSLRFGEDVDLTNVRLNFGSNGSTIDIGDRVVVQGRFDVVDGSRILIGAATFFNKDCLVQAWERTTITIGSGCLFANVKIRTSDTHSLVDSKTGHRVNAARDITLEDRVWLAEDVDVLKGATIGEGSVVGARALVTKNIPSFSLAVGVPAVVIRSGVTWDRKLLPMPATPQLLDYEI